MVVVVVLLLGGLLLLVLHSAVAVPAQEVVLREEEETGSECASRPRLLKGTRSDMNYGLDPGLHITITNSYISKQLHLHLGHLVYGFIPTVHTHIHSRLKHAR